MAEPTGIGDVNAQLFGADRAPIAKFESKGDKVEWSAVIDGETMHRRAYSEPGDPLGDLLYWTRSGQKTTEEFDQAGRPNQANTQIVLTVQTALRDPEIEDDDGVRRVFFAGRKTKGHPLEALRNALKAAKCKEIEIGSSGALWVTGGVGSPSKPLLFAASYAPPIKTVSLPDAMDE